VGEEQFEAGAGPIVFAPAGIPHKFRNIGPGRLETTDIHVQRPLDPDHPADPEDSSL
jgi:mannose-6-phosphate isomerase-like protein (cupin superfamily)